MLNLSLQPITVKRGILVANVEPVSIYQPTNSTMAAVSSLINNSKTDIEFIRLIGDRTPVDYRTAVTDILGQYRDVIVVSDEPTGYTTHMPFHIATGQAEPVAQRPYRIPVAQQAVVE